jgi:hypothetical protein
LEEEKDERIEIVCTPSVQEHPADPAARRLEFSIEAMMPTKNSSLHPPVASLSTQPLITKMQEEIAQLKKS